MTSVHLMRGRLMLAALSCLIASILASAPACAQSADGRTVFTERTTPSCGICHILDAAGTSGEIGPSLDELKPHAERVARAVRNGVGNSPLSLAH